MRVSHQELTLGFWGIFEVCKVSHSMGIIFSAPVQREHQQLINSIAFTMDTWKTWTTHHPTKCQHPINRPWAAEYFFDYILLYFIIFCYILLYFVDFIFCLFLVPYYNLGSSQLMNQGRVSYKGIEVWLKLVQLG